MASKHLSEETAFTRNRMTFGLTCDRCKASFIYEKEPGGDLREEPKFCPECGRRNTGDASA